MNPVLIIPTYWGHHQSEDMLDEQISTFDHVEGVDSRRVPNIARCLTSLEQMSLPVRIVICLSCDARHEDDARRRLQEICHQHEQLDTMIVGRREAQLLARAYEKITRTSSEDALSMYSYGSIKNVGLAAACVLGHDVVMFMDDDEEILDENFVQDALFGLGKKVSSGLPIYVKSGYFLDKHDSPYSIRTPVPWSDRSWNKHEAFNTWMSQALTGKRLSRSNVLTGGCVILHAEAFSRVPFDPWITRGEDLDYLINLKYIGIDVWFDNAWRVRHLPPRCSQRAPRFLQDMFRWIYQAHKIELANAKIDLQKITPETLMPYPGPWLDIQVERLIKRTIMRRILFSSERKAYIQMALSGLRQAHEHAYRYGSHYFKFQARWQRYCANIWCHDELSTQLLSAQQDKKNNL